MHVGILKTIATTLNIAEGNLTILSLNVTDATGAVVDVSVSITSDVTVKYSIVTAEEYDAKTMIRSLNAALLSYRVNEPATSGEGGAGGGWAGGDKTSNAFSQLISKYLSTPVTVSGSFFDPQYRSPEPTLYPTQDPTGYPTVNPTLLATGTPTGTDTGCTVPVPVMLCRDDIRIIQVSFSSFAASSSRFPFKSYFSLFAIHFTHLFTINPPRYQPLDELSTLAPSSVTSAATLKLIKGEQVTVIRMCRD